MNSSSKISNFSHAERVRYLKKHGVHSMAFSTMQPNMRYFDVSGIGYMTYAYHWGMNFVLSDPICEPKYFEIILDLFIQKFPNSLFVQVTKMIVEILHRKYNYFGTQCGLESKIILRHWNLKGSKKNVIRTALNQARMQGIVVKEEEFLEQSKKISQAWIKTRRRKMNEIHFLIRPLLMDYQEGVRFFYAYQNKEPIGFVAFDPIYKNGKVIAYVPNVSRSCSTFKQGLWYVILACAIEKFKEEEIGHIDLGIMPMKEESEIEFHESKTTRFFINKIYKWGNFIYNFKGLEFAKSRFQGDLTKVFYCHRTPLPVISILSMSRLARFL